MFTWKILVLLALFFYSEVNLILAKKGEPSGYRTIYTCEGRTLNMVCEEGLIHLIRANYGRFSIGICNEHGNLEWRVNCMSLHSFPIMLERCGAKPNCTVNVSSATFHDPCPGTLKYLEVQYHCGTGVHMITMPATSSSPTLKVSPPPNVTGNPNQVKLQTITNRSIISSIYPTFLPTTPLPKTTTTSASPIIPIIYTPNKTETAIKYSTTAKSIEVISTKLNRTGSSHITSSSTVAYSADEFCQPTFSRGISWSWTKAGEEATAKCPDGASGSAKWYCEGYPPHWSPEFPDLMRCQSFWLENLKERMDIGDSIIKVASELAVMSISKQLFSEDLKIISEMINQALYKSVNSMENYLDTWHRYHVLRELLQSSVLTLSNLLENKQDPAWKDIALAEKKILISTILSSLDQSALLLAETSSEDGSFILVKSNILMSLQVLKSKNPRTLTFPVMNELSTEDENTNWLYMQDSIVLPHKAIESYERNGFYKVVFIAFNKLNTYLKPTSSQVTLEHESENISQIINSRIIGASIDKSGNNKLDQPVIVTFKHLIEENVTSPVCVYWDFFLRDWSPQGCWVESSNKSHTVCLCNHLTNFALMMNLQAESIMPMDKDFLSMIIMVGCIISIVSLMITLTILCIISVDLTEDSVFIHRNMFFCLLLSELIFIAGINQTDHYIACAVIAGFLQYLFLATFSWMFFECYHQYITLIRSCDVKKGKCYWYYAASYLLPAIITGVSAIIDPLSYGTKYYCWLRADNYFVFSFVGPAVGIILGGMVFLCIALCMFFHKMSLTTTIIGNTDVNLSTFKKWNRRSFILITILCCTWTSAFLFINERSSSLAFIFSIFNSIQGAAILILYCFQNEKVKEEFKKVLRNDICFKKTKEQETQSTSQTEAVVNTSRDCISREFWAAATEKIPTSSNNVTDSSAPILASNSLNESDDDLISQNGIWMARNNTNWKSFYGMKNDISENTNMHSNHPEHQLAHQDNHQFLLPSDNGLFLDHIYETIDDDDLPDDNADQILPPLQRAPPKVYYCKNTPYSDQQSTSTYGFDKQPRLVVFQNRQNLSQMSCTMPKDCRIPHDQIKQARNQNRPIKRQKSLSDVSVAFKSSCHENSKNSSSDKFVPKNSSEHYEPSLPDLLQNPNDNSIVLAVLDGNKVVSRIQPDESIIQPHYKLSTYC
ncbi:latrophilin Cirl isoform X2 [Parasteatoda tepidariorum]|uniref:latrophilin Cirl isoform X2 n=1 Tax=Parasteatoda tepidariorum TaxID=114398 RepID=UPI00077FA3AB